MHPLQFPMRLILVLILDSGCKMARMALNELELLIGTTIPDNVTGLISPADVRNMMSDIIDSSTPSFALMWGDHSAVPVTKNVTTAWSVFSGTSLYSNTGTSDPSELPVDPSSGSMAVQFANFVHSVRGAITLTGAVNREIQFAVGHDGVPISGTSGLTLTGVNKQLSVMDDITFVAGSGWNLQLLIRAADGGASFDVSINSINMQATLEPTHLGVPL